MKVSEGKGANMSTGLCWYISLGCISNTGQHRDNYQRPTIIFVLFKMNSSSKQMNSSSKFSFSSTFNWEDANLRALLHTIPFFVERENDKNEPFCHYSHKNLGTKQAPFRQQQFRLHLDDLINIKYIAIDNYTHGAEMTISIADHQNGVLTEVYRDAYICKGKTLKGDKKMIDIGALPCRLVEIKVKKGSSISFQNISLVGVESSEIENKLGEDYFKLLVVNPMKILYIA